MDTQQVEKYYVIDHQEGPLHTWAKSELFQMISYMEKSKSHLVITNADTMICNDPNDESAAEYKECYEELKKELDKYNGRHFLIGKSVKDLVSEDASSVQIGDKSFPFKRTVLLDMRADAHLAPKDVNEFDVLIFGGILGDNPPRDRTKDLRDKGFIRRHLFEK